jgi:hypothetical protein
MVLINKKSKTPPIHHRKRQAHHHKRGKDYEKHYWPYLPLLGIVGLGFLLNLLWTPLSQHLSRPAVLSYATSTSIDGLLAQTNSERKSNSIGQLHINTSLNAAAQAKANDMAKRNYWLHVTPDGEQPWQFVTNAGYSYHDVGENLAYGFSDSATTISGWMHSEEHRDNLLDKVYTEVGFGIANARSYQGKGAQTIVVAFYGKPSTFAVTATVPETKLNAPAASQPVARMQLVSQQVVPQWSVWIVIAIVSLSAGVFLARHGRFIHRRLISGEHFVVTHPAFDMVIVAIITVGVLVTRTSGFIH